MLNSIPSLTHLVEELSKFPGVGRKTATRMAFYILGQTQEHAQSLATALLDVKRLVRPCSCCFNVTEVDPCPVCTAADRDDSQLCVVEQPQDLMAIERGHVFKGRYHVLHGALSPLDGIGPDDLKMAELIARVRQGQFREVVVATNFTLAGEATALYVYRVLQPLAVRVTRLAHGIPMGSDLEYVDDATVGHAIAGRRDF